jgi:hypothetical protein
VTGGCLRAVLKRAGRLTAAAVPLAQLARLGLPALISLGFLAVLALATVCWVIASDDRSRRVTQLIIAARGASAVPSPSPAPAGVVVRPRHRLRWGRNAADGGHYLP